MTSGVFDGEHRRIDERTEDASALPNYLRRRLRTFARGSSPPITSASA